METRKAFLTNFHKSDEALYKLAIELSGWSDRLWIEDMAYACNGVLLSDCKALYTNFNKSHEEFWRCFELLKKREV